MIQYYQNSNNNKNVIIAKKPNGHEVQVKISSSEKENKDHIKPDNLFDLVEKEVSDLMNID